jgi:hypothetical protein
MMSSGQFSLPIAQSVSRKMRIVISKLTEEKLKGKAKLTTCLLDCESCAYPWSSQKAYNQASRPALVAFPSPTK